MRCYSFLIMFFMIALGCNQVETTDVSYHVTAEYAIPTDHEPRLTIVTTEHGFTHVTDFETNFDGTLVEWNHSNSFTSEDHTVFTIQVFSKNDRTYKWVDEPFVDEDGDNIYDIGESFTDVDENGIWNQLWVVDWDDGPEDIIITITRTVNGISTTHTITDNEDVAQLFIKIE